MDEFQRFLSWMDREHPLARLTPLQRSWIKVCLSRGTTVEWCGGHRSGKTFAMDMLQEFLDEPLRGDALTRALSDPFYGYHRDGHHFTVTPDSRSFDYIARCSCGWFGTFPEKLEMVESKPAAYIVNHHDFVMNISMPLLWQDEGDQA